MSKRYTFKDVKKIVEDADYELLSLEKDIANDKGYVFMTTKIEVWCKNSNHKSELKVLADFKRGKSRCRQCKYNKHAEKLKHSFDYIYNFIKSEGCELLSTEYKNNGEKLKIKCNKNHTFLMNFRDFQQGYRCPHCSESKGEKEISKTLNNLKIKYFTQYKFNDCVRIFHLKFDFYLPDYNCCIEFDGIQHFEPTDFAGKGEEWALDRFIKCIINDTIKNDYCKKNNINLIRISYKDFDKIEEIIKNRISFND